MTPRLSLLFSLLAVAALSLSLSISGCSSDADKNDDACMPDDADGIVAEPATLTLNVDDTEFSPKILTTQNTSPVTLTVTNQGATPHSFVVDCKATPNTDGCPTQSCFPDGARTEQIAPGESMRIVFETPAVEGVYTFRSDVTGDTLAGQFIIQ